MHALIPLLLILILFNRRQLENDKLYRANVFALVGISYFVLFQYTLYWYRIFPSDGIFQFVPGVAIVISTVMVALSHWNKRSHPLKTGLLCALCAAAIVITLGLDHTLKEKLAELGGYFKSEATTQKQPASAAYENEEVPAIGARIALSGMWSKKTLDTNHVYFVLQGDAGPMAELRPNCLGDFKIDTPTFVLNTLELFEAGTSGAAERVTCTRNRGIKHCLVTVKYASSLDIAEKWRWFKIQQDRSKSIMIDVLIFVDEPGVRKEISDALASAQPTENGPSEPCRTPAVWL